MPRKKTDPVLSAQVILRPRGRRSSRGLEITSANVAGLVPDADVAARVARYFQETGFEVGVIVGTSFAISGAAATFERVFGTKMARRKELALPLHSIDSEVAEEVEEVTFTPPPDFGPTSY
jgi:fructose-1,6-bisphosphatase/sedoheptulose 1,7-bisphosphatase-like protein